MGNLRLSKPKPLPEPGVFFWHKDCHEFVERHDTDAGTIKIFQKSAENPFQHVFTKGFAGKGYYYFQDAAGKVQAVLSYHGDLDGPDSCDNVANLYSASPRFPGQKPVKANRKMRKLFGDAPCYKWAKFPYRARGSLDLIVQVVVQTDYSECDGTMDDEYENKFVVTSNAGCYYNRLVMGLDCCEPFGLGTVYNYGQGVGILVNVREREHWIKQAVVPCRRTFIHPSEDPLLMLATHLVAYEEYERHPFGYMVAHGPQLA